MTDFPELSCRRAEGYVLVYHLSCISLGELGSAEYGLRLLVRGGGAVALVSDADRCICMIARGYLQEILSAHGDHEIFMTSDNLLQAPERSLPQHLPGGYLSAVGKLKETPKARHLLTVVRLLIAIFDLLLCSP